MSLKSRNVLTAPRVESIIALEPATNVLMMLRIMDRAEELIGLHEWIVETAAKLTPEQQQNNHLIFGFFLAAVQPDHDWPSFPDYVDHLSKLNPVVFQHTSMEDLFPVAQRKKLNLPELKQMLKEFALFEQTVFALYPDAEVEAEMLREVHAFLVNPEKLKKMIITHFQTMWDQWLKEEWERTEPLLQASVNELKQVDLSGLATAEEIVCKLLCDGCGSIDELKGDFDPNEIRNTQKIIIIPSIHLGHWSEWFYDNGLMRYLFPAERIPGKAQETSLDLGHTDLLVRLSSIVDDTRLQILKLFTRHESLRAQDIMDQLDLSQSSASRHLIHLATTGFLKYHKKEREKWYRMNPERIKESIRALENYLELQ